MWSCRPGNTPEDRCCPVARSGARRSTGDTPIWAPIREKCVTVSKAVLAFSSEGTWPPQSLEPAMKFGTSPPMRVTHNHDLHLSEPVVVDDHVLRLRLTGVLDGLNATEFVTAFTAALDEA